MGGHGHGRQGGWHRRHAGLKRARRHGRQPPQIRPRTARGRGCEVVVEEEESKGKETQPTLDDPADDVQLRFRAVAFIMCLWCLVLASYLRETPPTTPKTAMQGEAQPPSARGKSPARRGRGSKSPHPAARSSHKAEANQAPKGGPSDGEGDRKGNMSSFLRELRDTMTQPIFLLGLLVQTAITPIAEFQSQLPLLLTRDAQLTAADVNQGNSLWHAGVLVAVLVAGRVFDRMSPLTRISLVGLPLLANAVLFVLVSTSVTVAGRAKLPLVFLLGATHGPANYLIYNSQGSNGDGELLSEVVTLGVHLLLHVQRGAAIPWMRPCTRPSALDWSVCVPRWRSIYASTMTWTVTLAACQAALAASLGDRDLQGGWGLEGYLRLVIIGRMD